MFCCTGLHLSCVSAEDVTVLTSKCKSAIVTMLPVVLQNDRWPSLILFCHLLFSTTFPSPASLSLINLSFFLPLLAFLRWSLNILPPPSFVSFQYLSFFSLSVSLSLSLCPCRVSGWGATLSDSNCTDVNDILLMLSATSDTGARRGHSAAQTQGCSQTAHRNRSILKLDCDGERGRGGGRRGIGKAAALLGGELGLVFKRG